MEQTIKQPELKDKKELLGLFKKEKINIPGTKDILKIGYMKGYTLEKLSEISLWWRENYTKFDKKSTKYKMRMAAKEVSYGVLNGMKIYFFHWIYWRYLYYVKGYTFNQLEPVIELIKKKIPLREYSKATMLASMNDVTVMSLSKEEQEATQAELLSEKEDKSEKTING